MVEPENWTLLGEDEYILNGQVRHTAWQHDETTVRVYLETEYHPDTHEDEYLVAWMEPDGDWPIMESFEDYDAAERYAHDLVLTYTEGKF